MTTPHREFHVRVPIPNISSDHVTIDIEVIDWLDEHCGTFGWLNVSSGVEVAVFAFEFEEHAMLFKLCWG